jgi:toxin ParE1/3/4
VKVVWLPSARVNLADAINYIAQENAVAALDQLDEIEQQSDKLVDYPQIGRPGRNPGTRELVVIRTPFILIYRVQEHAQQVEILRMLHSAQQ